ncbi:MAG: FG-GAP repeat protein, partial [Flavobacteriales bacterium]|nr:FG-GAP repeat protein [Flavobacteriales bacterium]
FKDRNGHVVVSYDELAVWDATGKALDAAFQLSSEGGERWLQIVVDDATATYPLTIDPVSSNPSRSLISAISGIEFGVSVATAGDLNGDGFSDVVVGARLADFGFPNAGAAFVYYGSVNGIGATEDVLLDGGQQGAQMGSAVSSAGDVNGDGYSDLMVGVRNWESDPINELSEGATFIYYGSATGIANLPDLILQPDHAGDNFGSNVATLGDINADGYSDVVVGAYLAEYPSYQEGAAFIYLGSAAGLTNVPFHRLEPQQAGAHFSRSVSGAGDINGDGYDDVIIGASKWVVTPGGNDQGAALIWYGGPTGLGGGFNPPHDLLLTGSLQNLAAYGWSVACAGDVDGDGYSDVAVSAYRDNNGEANEGQVYVYHGTAAGLDPVPRIVLESNQANAWMGRWVSTAGDVNGDGYADLLVGSPQFSNPQATEGIASLYLGSSTGISSNAFIVFDENNVGANLGECVSTAGDVNGDGYSDVIIGAKIYGNGGAAFIYHGGPYYMSMTSSSDAFGGAANMELGRSVANAGDINGDGFSDLVVGAPLASNGQAGEGLAWIHYGSAIGPGASPDLVLEANSAGGALGTSVASAGDVNGDGYADVIIGAPNIGTGGRIFVHHGGPAGLNPVASRILNGPAGSQFGTSVHTTGDINSDGYADIIIGAPGGGLAMIYLGSAAGIGTGIHATLNDGSAADLFGASVGTAGDVNGDGFSDVIVGSPEQENGQVNEGMVFIYHGSELGIVTPFATSLEINSANARFGTSVAGAGDTDGDGFYDVVVGAPLYSNGQIDEGAAFVFYGSPAGIVAAGSTTLERNWADARLGSSVAEAGDINGDGYADVVVGAPLYENTGTQVDEGQVLVYRGSPSGIQPFAYDGIQGNVAGHQFGAAVAGGGDLDGDGYSDVIGGGPLAAPAFAAEGSWRWHRGNRAYSLNRISRQYQADLSSPLATNCMDFSNPDFFGIGHFARSPMHRSPGRLQWEVVFEGQPFSGGPITNSVASTGMGAAWTDLGVGGTEIKELIYKTPGFIRYKWRVRVEYKTTSLLDGQRFSRWFYGYASGVGDIGVLPIELVDLRAYAQGPVNVIDWVTASEQASERFVVERSLDNFAFVPVAERTAAGESLHLIDYRAIDEDPPLGLAFYRLAMFDQDGTMEHSPTVTVLRSSDGIEPLELFPNPTDLNARLVGVTEHVRVLEILDALGRPVRVRDIPIEHSGVIDLDLSDLGAGRYLVMLKDASGTVLERGPLVKL